VSVRLSVCLPANFRKYTSPNFRFMLPAAVPGTYRVSQKSETKNSWPWFCQILTDFQKLLTGRFLRKVVTKNPKNHCICCHTILWNINVIKRAINDKLRWRLNTLSTAGFVDDVRLCLPINGQAKATQVGRLLKLTRQGQYRIGTDFYDCLKFFLK